MHQRMVFIRDNNGRVCVWGGTYVVVTLFVYLPSIIITVDTSRLRLSFIPGVEGSDYINANYVDVSEPTRPSCHHVMITYHRATTVAVPTSPRKVPYQTQQRTSGGWCGSRSVPPLSC